MGYFDTPLRTPDKTPPPPADIGDIQIEVVPDPEGIIPVDEQGNPLDGSQLPVEPEAIPFSANLAEYMEDGELSKLVAQLMADFDADERARQPWYKMYTDGLELLGMRQENRTRPWDGASGVVHPVLLEAVIRFQAQTIMDVFPASGPVKTKIIGKQSEEILKRAQRVQEEMNYICTERMKNYRPETDQLLFHLPLAGTAFRKIYYDKANGRPDAMFIPAEDFVVPYGASDLSSCPRYSHIIRMFKHELDEHMHSGFYRKIDLAPPTPDYSTVEKKEQQLSKEMPSVENDDRYTLIEMHVNVHIDGWDDEDAPAPPYIITFEKQQRKVLAIRRNWAENDVSRHRIAWFAPFKYLPGFGFYGLGLIHIMGGLAKSSTSILRQLIDAGTLANLPAGLKTKGLRIKNEDTPLEPGEFRDVDMVIGSSIKDNITFVPYKEPSGVLYQLLLNLVEEARRVGSEAEIKISDIGSQTPVGTIIALIERSMKVTNAVNARIHGSMAEEFKILARVILENEGDEYEYEHDIPARRSEDFGPPISIIPVSDPNATTMAQRVIQYQAAGQLAASAPEIYDIRELHRSSLLTLGIKDVDKLIPNPQQSRPLDPVEENMNILNMKPIAAFQSQDHDAHLKVHIAFMNDPKIREMVGQSQRAGAIQSAMEAHIAEHMAFFYRAQIEMKLGVPLPPVGQPLPPDVENDLARLSAAAADKVLADNVRSYNDEKARQQLEDPVIQMQLEELEIEKKKTDAKIAADAEEAALKRQRLKLDKEKLDSNERIQGARIAATVSTDAAQIGTKFRTEILKNAVKDAQKPNRKK